VKRSAQKSSGGVLTKGGGKTNEKEIEKYGWRGDFQEGKEKARFGQHPGRGAGRFIEKRERIRKKGRRKKGGKASDGGKKRLRKEWE